MTRHAYPAPVDHGRFVSGADPDEVKYGLPRNIAFCSRCVISNQRPNSAVEFKHTKSSRKTTIDFDAEGICDACRFAEKKKNRSTGRSANASSSRCATAFAAAMALTTASCPDPAARTASMPRTCSSTNTACIPLTVTWAPHIYTEWGWKNFQSWIHAGFDNYLCTPNGRVHRLLTRLAVENLFHPFQAFMLGQK